MEFPVLPWNLCLGTLVSSLIKSCKEWPLEATAGTCLIVFFIWFPHCGIPKIVTFCWTMSTSLEMICYQKLEQQDQHRSCFFSSSYWNPAPFLKSNRRRKGILYPNTSLSDDFFPLNFKIQTQNRSKWPSFERRYLLQISILDIHVKFSRVWPTLLQVCISFELDPLWPKFCMSWMFPTFAALFFLSPWLVEGNKLIAFWNSWAMKKTLVV